jgi:nucleoid-associated protein EbfC
MNTGDLDKMQKMMPQLLDMQEKMLQNLAAITVEASSGGGAVTVRMNGRKELLKLTIAPSAASAAAGDITLLEDLIVAAINQANQKANEATQAGTPDLLSSLGLPSF